MLALLRRRDFGLLWSAGLVSVAGDWVLFAALPYFVYARTGSTVATAGMVVAELAPAVALGSVAGVYVDRWPRKRILVAGALAQSATVALLLLVPHGGPLWVVYAVAVAQSCVAAFTVPAESALLPALVEDAELVRANALNVLNNRLGRLGGVPLGGLLLAHVGLDGVVLVDCASFLLAALLLAPVRAPAPPPAGDGAAAGAARAFRREWVDGLLLVVRVRPIRTLALVFGLMTFGGTMLDPLDVAWVRDVLGQGPDVFALLSTTHAVLGIAGSLAVARVGLRAEARDLMGWGSLVAGGTLALQYNVPVVALAFALAAVRGVTSSVSSIGVETLVQRQTPDAYRGRVYGALGASGALLSLAGAATGGLLAEAVGVVPALDLAAGLVAVSGAVVLLVFPRARTAAAAPALAESE